MPVSHSSSADTGHSDGAQGPTPPYGIIIMLQVGAISYINNTRNAKTQSQLGAKEWRAPNPVYASLCDRFGVLDFWNIHQGFLAAFHEFLGAPSIMMGFGLIDDDIHSPNERFRLDHFYKGIEACAHFYSGAAGRGK